MSKKKRNIKNKDNSNIGELRKYDIFKYLLPNANTILLGLKGIDLQDLLVLLDEVILLLRNELGFEKNITFGTEIEAEYVDDFEKVQNIIEHSLLNKWHCEYDGSLSEGIEVISPILTDNVKCWKNLKEICTILKSHASIDEYSGAHIHIGSQILGKNPTAVLNFIKIWVAYENILYRFSYGEFLSPRPEIISYAKPLKQEIIKYYPLLNLKYCINDLDNLITYFGKYYGVNLEKASFELNDNEIEEYNTIEFRTPNGTLEPVIWQNNINLFVKLIKYCKSSHYNEDIINKRLYEKLNSRIYFENYNEIYLEQALELCDLIFDNNLDKIYFLRQYLKSLEMPKEEFQKAKKFV